MQNRHKNLKLFWLIKKCSWHSGLNYSFFCGKINLVMYLLHQFDFKDSFFHYTVVYLLKATG